MADRPVDCFYCRGGAGAAAGEEALGQLVCGWCYAHQVILAYQGRQASAADLAVAEVERMLRAGKQ